jgi:hypothetical protein
VKFFPPQAHKSITENLTNVSITE